MNSIKSSFISTACASAVTALCLGIAGAAPFASAGEVTLQDDQVLVTFDDTSGALTRLEGKATGWDIERRPELGLSFQMSVLVSGGTNETVRGEKQHGAQVKKISANQVQMRWKDLVSDDGKELPMTLTTTISLSKGQLTFEATLENHSSQMVESIEYPRLGDLTPPAPGVTLEEKHMWYADLKSGKITGSRTVESKQSLFCLIQAPDRGVYVEMKDPTQPYLLGFAFDQRGSVKSTGTPERMEFCARHVAYVHPNSTMTLAPIVVRCYQGDWHAGVDCYKEWRATWFKQPHLAAWVKDVNSWQQLQIDTPEQDFRVPYTNLLAYGEECATNGVNAIQLVGWNHGGQDGGDPAQDTEPGLGTWQQLHDVIAKIQARGVKMILFAKLNWADLTTDWYTNELYKYQCEDPSGKRYEQGGYMYFTPTQLAGIGVHKRAVMDFDDPAYQDVATKEFKKILALGSDGWLWDEVCHHAVVNYNFAPGHGYTPPGYVYGGDLPLGKRLRAAADKVSEDFLFSGEAPQDWLLQYFPFSYFRINADSVPVSRYVDSQAPLSVTVTGFDDREILNLILMDRYIISYEPYNFKGHLADYPLTLAYGKKIDALRRRYKDSLWDAEFRDTLGANVTANGSVRYTVFVKPSGKRTVVVVNMEYAKPITATVDMPNAGKFLVATPEKPEAVETSRELKIPARSAAVVMEQ